MTTLHLVELILHVAVSGCLVALCATVGVLLYQLKWSGGRLLTAWGKPSIHQFHLLCRRVVPALRAGQSAAPALRSAAVDLRWPFTTRLAAAARRLESGQPPTLVQTLVQHDLLPARLRPLAQAAEAGGVAMFLRWFEWIGCRERIRDPGGWLMPSLWTAIIMLSILSFVQVVIIPKFQAIMQELGVEPSGWALQALASGVISHFALAVCLLGFLVLVGWGWWSRRRLAFRGRAVLLCAGTAIGLDERNLGRLLAVSQPRQQAACEQAGDAGNLPALIRLAGWQAASPAALADQLDRRERFDERIELIGITLIARLLPFVLATPVLIYAVAMWGALMQIARYAGGDS